MKKLPALVLLVPALFFACRQTGETSQAKAIIETIRQEYAPDKRVALFRVDTTFAKIPVLLLGETNLPAAKQALIEQLTAAGIPFTDSLALLPSPSLAGLHHGIVNVSVCNIRSEPKHASELATQALLGTPLRVWKKEGNFYLVQTPDDYLGWLDAGGAICMDASQWEAWMQSERAIVTTDYVFAYEQAAETSQKITDLLAGNILQTIENQGRFTKVKLPDGRTGHVLTNHLAPLRQWLDSRQPDAAHIIATAMEMMGRPYLWGGTSGKGMDCSGFTKMVFFLNGLLLPRDASQQVLIGDPIETDTTLANLLPGDLLFFGKKATPDQREKITHVAIYLGDGKIIHASTRVEIESLRRGEADFAEERLLTFVRGRRVIGMSEGMDALRVR